MLKAHLVANREDAKADFPLSVSRSKTFLDCSAKYRYNYIEELPRKEWDFHVLGKFCHEVLELFHGRQIEAGKRADVPGPLMSQAWADALPKYPTLSEAQKTEAFPIIKDYLARWAGDQTEVLSVERGFFIDVEGDVLLNGFIDRIQLDPDGVLHVADYKTTKQKRYLKDTFQLKTYALVLMLEDPGLQIVRGSYIALRHKSDHLTTEFTREEVLAVQDKFSEIAAQIRAEKLWRPSPSRLCRFCDFLDHCEGGSAYLGRSSNAYGKSTW